MESLLAHHDKNQPPYHDRPTEVLLGIYVTSFFSISEQTMDYSLSMYFRQAWRDPRMSFRFVRDHKIRLMDESWKKFWVPDTYFRNEKSASFHKITVNNRILTVNATGHLWYVARITTTLSCPMRLEKFPFDAQRCPMQFESFGFTMDTVYFGWIQNAVDHPADLKLPQFQLIASKTRDCSANYTTGAYPCSEINFILQRDIGYFVIQVFVPSFLTVILSWVSFWINIDGVPARCTLGLVTVLTIATQSSSVNATLPRVSYIKAIDVWLIVCLLFVFCALLEYAFVNVAARNGVRLRTPIVREASLEKPQSPPDSVSPKRRHSRRHHRHFHDCKHSYKEVCGTESDDGFERDFHLNDQNIVRKCWQRLKSRLPFSSSADTNFKVTVDVEASKLKARRIDKVARKSFPLAFLIFNVIYWISASIPAANHPLDEE
uniref:Putative GABA receptor 5 n=1 Tax=Hirudo verbana TaxID=311461 RepID=A0A2S1WLY3_9ANNE|nr:putative GABA receptor 5 [Hirudo verbana]